MKKLRKAFCMLLFFILAAGVNTQFAWAKEPGEAPDLPDPVYSFDFEDSLSGKK